MAKRIIILVRHGQYHKATDKTSEKLTNLGKKQASFAAKRLKEYDIDRIIHSTMPRAIETANIIKQGLGFRKKLIASKDLCECVPGFPKTKRKKYGYTNVKQLKADQQQADRAYKKYFKASKEKAVDVLVCHGNIIRYLVCKTLGVDTLTWLAMDIQQCGISIVEIRSKGSNKRVLISHNDIGHIPKQQRTFI